MGYMAKECNDILTNRSSRYQKVSRYLEAKEIIMSIRPS